MRTWPAGAFFDKFFTEINSSLNKTAKTALIETIWPGNQVKSRVGELLRVTFLKKKCVIPMSNPPPHRGCSPVRLASYRASTT